MIKTIRKISRGKKGDRNWEYNFNGWTENTCKNHIKASEGANPADMRGRSVQAGGVGVTPS